MKFRLGLFERPYVEPPSGDALPSSRRRGGARGPELARRSLVLVENDGVLPLAPTLGRVAVVGPIADSARDLLGDYSHMVHMETLREMRARENAFGFPLDARIDPADELAGRPTILDAIADAARGDRVVHARGTGLRDGTDAEIAEAVGHARGADVAIVVLGERSGLTDDATTGEFRDRRDLGFLGRQQELLEAVVATGTPVVLVVVSGRPLAIDWAAEHCAAILLAWVPGDCRPGGDRRRPDRRREPRRQAAGHDPARRRPGAAHVSPPPVRRSLELEGRLRRRPGAPLWPFGFGRSYTTFALSRLRARSDRAARPTADELRVSVDVANTGDRAGDEVVQLYARDEEASVARPVRELLGFRGCRSRRASAARSVRALRRAVRLRRRRPPARRRARSDPPVAGTSAADLPLEADVDLVGPMVHLVERQRYLTRTDLS